MNKIQLFFYALRRTFTSPSYYADILRAPFSFSLKYFLAFYFLAAILLTALFAINAYPPINQFVTAAPGQFLSAFPADFQVTIRDGELSTNVKEPFVVPLSVLYGTGNGDADGPNLLVIDTQANVEDFPKYHAVVLITKRAVIADDDDQLRVTPLSEMDDTVISKAVMIDLYLRLTPYLRYLFPAFVGIVFIVNLVRLPVTYLLYLVLLSVIGFVVFKIMKLPGSYGKAYQLGLHLITVTTAITFVIERLGFELQSICLWQVAVFTILVVRAARSVRKQATQASIDAVESPAA